VAWVRLHDGAMQNMKITALSDSAFRLWIRGLCYCQTALTDGLIPHGALRDMGARRRDVDELAAVQIPGRSPLWERIDAFGFKVHDYLAWNDSRDVVEARQHASAERKAKWREGTRSETRSGRVKNTIAGTHNQTKPNQTSTKNPPTPLTGGPIRRDERKRAEDLRRKTFGCNHEPRCPNTEACIVTIVLGLREQAATA